MLSTSVRENAAGEEAEFLEQVAALFGPQGSQKGKAELANWGGWYRVRFRENPDKARRVLAEVATMVRERKIHTCPGAAVFDLWNRLP